MYEHHREPLLGRAQFLRRLSRHGLLCLGIVASSLAIGAVGYHVTAGLAWIDAFLNASMILTGMGPVNAMTTDASKLFAAFFALYSGVVFVATIGILVAPVLHRMLHRMHLSA